jgi:hypothetical protein
MHTLCPFISALLAVAPFPIHVSLDTWFFVQFNLLSHRSRLHVFRRYGIFALLLSYRPVNLPPSVS